jgi:hypothetical protein
MKNASKASVVLGGVALLVALAWLAPKSAYYFVVDRWEGRSVEWNGLRIELDDGKYFLKKGQLDLLIGTRNGNDGILQLSPKGIEIEKRRRMISAECANAKCSLPFEREYLDTSRKVVVLEYSYESGDPRDEMQAYVWVEGSSLSISYRGSKATYGQFSTLVSSITTQIAKSTSG